MRPEITVLPSPDAVASALATRTAAAIRQALDGEPRATLCLTGGSTPEPAYRQLARAEGIDWDRVHVFWGDERAVGPDDEDSNFRMAREALLDPVGLPDTNVHRIEGERGADEAARRYEADLEFFFGDDGVAFDVLHLGMGGDGHMASLFPGSPALGERDRRAIDTQSPPSSPVRHRVTLTYPAFAGARLTLVAAHGAGKREAFADVVGAYDRGVSSDAPPVARVATAGELVWLVDEALADGLV